MNIQTTRRIPNPSLSSLISKMEPQFFFSFDPLNVFLLFSFLFILFKGWKRITSPPTPPGPWNLPIIGSLHHLMGVPPHFALRDMAKKFGPIMHLKYGQVPVVIISSPALAKEVLQTHDPAFAVRPDFLAMKIMSYNKKDVVFSEYDDYWKQMRKICTMEVLSPKMVRSFAPVRTDESLSLVENIRSSAGKLINLSEMVNLTMSSIIFRASFGKTRKAQDRLVAIKTLKESLLVAGGFDVADMFPSLEFLHVFSFARRKIVKMQKEVDAIFEDIVNDRIQSRASKKIGSNEKAEDEDVVDVLLRIKESGNLQFPITNTNIKAIIYDMFAAGTDNIGAAVLWAMSELMRNPKVMEKLQTEIREIAKEKKGIDESDIKKMKYLKLVVEETLRLHPIAAYLMPRECREQREIGGYIIPVKTRVLFNFWAIVRDPEHWSDPESFKPERFEDARVDYRGTHFEYLPFGSGKRMCPGSNFAVAAVEHALAQLCYHFNWSLPDGIKPEELDMTETAGGLTQTKFHDLCLIPTPYNS